MENKKIAINKRVSGCETDTTAASRGRNLSPVRFSPLKTDRVAHSKSPACRLQRGTASTYCKCSSRYTTAKTLQARNSSTLVPLRVIYDFPRLYGNSLSLSLSLSLSPSPPPFPLFLYVPPPFLSLLFFNETLLIIVAMLEQNFYVNINSQRKN